MSPNRTKESDASQDIFNTEEERGNEDHGDPGKDARSPLKDTKRRGDRHRDRGGQETEEEPSGSVSLPLVDEQEPVRPVTASFGQPRFVHAQFRLVLAIPAEDFI